MFGQAAAPVKTAEVVWGQNVSGLRLCWPVVEELLGLGRMGGNHEVAGLVQGGGLPGNYGQ